MELYKKYRPKKLMDMVGNNNTISSLKSVVARERPPHAFLFTGPTGVGKTTLARITARMLDCAKGSRIELNTASYRGIDAIRELLQQMVLMPLEGKVRVYTLDECHQISKDGQEALLKALEDTPSHVYFLLCTTNPEKLKQTLKNRCTRFDLQPLSEEEIISLLTNVLGQEKKTVNKKILQQIATDSLGSARAALVMLDQIIDLPPEKMSAAARRAAESEQESISLCRALIKKERWEVVSKILKGLSEQDAERLRLAVLGYCKSILLGGAKNNQAFFIMETMKEPFYNTGQAGLVKACYEIING